MNNAERKLFHQMLKIVLLRSLLKHLDIKILTWFKYQVRTTTFISTNYILTSSNYIVLLLTFPDNLPRCKEIYLEGVIINNKRPSLLKSLKSIFQVIKLSSSKYFFN